jgi:hypothetical protein
LIKGETFFRNSVSSQNAVAYGSVLSTNRGSSSRNSLILFSSQLFIKFLYPITCDANSAHLSVNFKSHHQYIYPHAKTHHKNRTIDTHIKYAEY